LKRVQKDFKHPIWFATSVLFKEDFLKQFDFYSKGEYNQYILWSGVDQFRIFFVEIEALSLIVITDSKVAYELGRLIGNTKYFNSGVLTKLLFFKHDPAIWN